MTNVAALCDPDGSLRTYVILLPLPAALSPLNVEAVISLDVDRDGRLVRIATSTKAWTIPGEVAAGSHFLKPEAPET